MENAVTFGGRQAGALGCFERADGQEWNLGPMPNRAGFNAPCLEESSVGFVELDLELKQIESEVLELELQVDIPGPVGCVGRRSLDELAQVVGE